MLTNFRAKTLPELTLLHGDRGDRFERRAPKLLQNQERRPHAASQNQTSGLTEETERKPEINEKLINDLTLLPLIFYGRHLSDD